MSALPTFRTLRPAWLIPLSADAPADPVEALIDGSDAAEVEIECGDIIRAPSPNPHMPIVGRVRLLGRTTMHVQLPNGLFVPNVPIAGARVLLKAAALTNADEGRDSAT